MICRGLVCILLVVTSSSEFMTAFGASFGSGLAVASSNYNANKDTEVASPPSDSISSLSFSPAANYLIATSWDNQVRCYEVQANGQSAGKAAISHDQPVLCSDWSADGSTVFTGKNARSCLTS